MVRREGSTLILELPAVDGPDGVEAALALALRLDALKKEWLARAALSRLESFLSQAGVEPMRIGWLAVGSGPRQLSARQASNGYSSERCRQAERLLSPFRDQLSGAFEGEWILDAQDGLRLVGVGALGQQGFDRWRAEVEKARLGEVAQAPEPGARRAL